MLRARGRPSAAAGRTRIGQVWAVTEQSLRERQPLSASQASATVVSFSVPKAYNDESKQLYIGITQRSLQCGSMAVLASNVTKGAGPA